MRGRLLLHATLVAAVATTAAPHPGPSQVCSAAPSLRSVGYRAGASLGVANQVRTLSVAAAAGLRTSPLYAGAGVGLAKMGDIHRTAVTTAFRLGLESAPDELHASGACVFLTGGSQTGPKNIRNTGVDYSNVTVGAGLAIGRALRRWDGGSVTAAAEAVYQQAFYRNQSSTGWVTGSIDQEMFTLTLGLSTGRLLFQVSLIQPADLVLRDTSFRVGIALTGAKS